jgi:hypothetical protein
MFLLKAGYEEVHFSHRFRKNRTLFFETGISDRKRSVLEKKLGFDEWSGKTIVFLNQGAAFILFRISLDISETLWAKAL